MYTHYPDYISSTLYPVMYRNSQASADSLLVNVYIDSENVGSFRAAPAGTSAGQTYFDIDVMGFCAANVAPFVRTKSSLFGMLDDFYRSKALDNDPVDCFKELYLTSYPESISSAGYLVTSTAADTSSATYIIPADLYATTYSLNQFRQPSATPEMYFLTAMRDPRKMRPSQNCFLTYLMEGIDAAEFTFYTAAGSTTTVIIDLVIFDDTLQTFSCGLANILGKVAGGDLVFHVGSFPSTSTPYTYYTVSLGTYSGVYTRESEILRFDIVPDCEDKIELHWFGKHSGAESMVIEGGRVDSTKVGGDLVNVTQPWNVIGSPRRNPYDKSVIRTDTTVEPETRVQCAVTPEEAAYLETLFYSPEVYVVRGGEYISCTIENGTIKRSDNRAPFIEVDFTIVYGQKVNPKL